MSKNMYISEKVFRFLSLSIVGIAFNIAISYASSVSKEVASTSAKLTHKVESVQVQTISMKTNDNLPVVELRF